MKRGVSCSRPSKWIASHDHAGLIADCRRSGHRFSKNSELSATPMVSDTTAATVVTTTIAVTIATTIGGDRSHSLGKSAGLPCPLTYLLIGLDPLQPVEAESLCCGLWSLAPE